MVTGIAGEFSRGQSCGDEGSDHWWTPARLVIGISVVLNYENAIGIN